VLHQPDKWDRAPLVRIDFPELRQRLGLEEGQKHVAPEALSKATMVDEELGRTIPLSAWAERVLEKDKQGEVLTELEEKGLELANRLWAYQNHRMGRGLEIMPLQGSEAQDWMPVGHVLLTSFDDSNDPSGAYRRVKSLLWEARTAYQQKDAAKLNRAAEELKTVLRSAGPELGSYPAASTIDLEVAYNRWAPFRFAWALMLLASIAMFLHFGTERTLFYRGAFALYGAGIVAAIVGFAMRIGISGRAPVTNMYESVVYVGTGVAVLGLVFELIYRKKYILSAAAAVSTFTLVLADNCPAILDPSVRPLEPVLRSNFWLTTHVMTITLSYAAFALALGIANITLGYFLVGSKNVETIGALTRFTYKAIQVGVLLLAAGVILGGVWADYSWGRFWGWDPKEVWALVALLGYLAVLHARFAGWVHHRGLAALSVFCFSLVVMAWYGVNFVLGAGLHSYGFGGGGRGWVFTVVLLQLLYASAAMMRSSPEAPTVAAPTPEAPPANLAQLPQA
jgi:cytochrome c-type biogenesis protein CcsB